MPIPPWFYFSNAISLEYITSVVDVPKFHKKSIYLTDARRVGVMLRERRLTLRNHSAITRLVVETVSDTDFVLQAPAVGDKPYIKIGSKGAFVADASHDEAQKFQLEVTDLGIELWLAGQRPAVFDDNNDVSIGKWETGLSPIPMIIHDDLAKIWAPCTVQNGRDSSGGVQGVP